MMTDSLEDKLGEKTSHYCTVCKEEQPFVWAVGMGVEFMCYPAEKEYGWECSACGSKVGKT